MMRIAVLMTVHSRREKTLRCLDLLYAQQPAGAFSLEVFLTDDGSTDGTSEAVLARYPDVHVIAGDGTLFWCRGMLEAWKAADGGAFHAFLWLNDDTFLFPSAVRVLLETADRHPGCLIVGATCSAADGRFTYGGRKGKKLEHVEGEVPLDTFDGNIVLVPASVRAAVGLLDPRFSHAMGDTEYGLRATSRGIGIWQTGEFLGTCEEHHRLSAWCNPAVPLRKRWAALRSPLGCPPAEYFYVDARYRGLGTALKHYFTIHFRVLFPKLWITEGRDET